MGEVQWIALRSVIRNVNQKINLFLYLFMDSTPQAFFSHLSHHQDEGKHGTALLQTRKKASQTRVRSARVYEEYLGGPIPLQWIDTAARLGGQALLVGLLIWHYTTMRKEPVALTPTLLTKHGVPKSTGHWAVKQLEASGLIRVRRNGHHAPLIEVIRERLEVT